MTSIIFLWWIVTESVRHQQSTYFCYSFIYFSSANAKKWEVELTTLKNNNARLTSALQESTANVEEWKRQLNSYKEENSRLKMSLIELEAGRGNI